MSETPITMGSEEDLPRTVRQQKEARARDQMAREILNAPRPAYNHGQNRSANSAAASAASAASTITNHMAADYSRASEFDGANTLPPGEYPPATVARLDVPFLHLVVFCLKAVLAAIPALLLLMLILWGVGQIAQMYLPWLVKMRILITFPG